MATANLSSHALNGTRLECSDGGTNSANVSLNLKGMKYYCFALLLSLFNVITYKLVNATCGQNVTVLYIVIIMCIITVMIQINCIINLGEFYFGD